MALNFYVCFSADRNSTWRSSTLGRSSTRVKPPPPVRSNSSKTNYATPVKIDIASCPAEQIVSFNAYVWDLCCVYADMFLFLSIFKLVFFLFIFFSASFFGSLFLCRFWSNHLDTIPLYLSDWWDVQPWAPNLILLRSQNNTKCSCPVQLYPPASFIIIY